MQLLHQDHNEPSILCIGKKLNQFLISRRRHRRTKQRGGWCSDMSKYGALPNSPQERQLPQNNAGIVVVRSEKSRVVGVLSLSIVVVVVVKKDSIA
jgi:hypothetical protein